jgi:hypothetical protein
MVQKISPPWGVLFASNHISGYETFFFLGGHGAILQMVCTGQGSFQQPFSHCSSGAFPVKRGGRRAEDINDRCRPKK